LERFWVKTTACLYCEQDSVQVGPVQCRVKYKHIARLPNWDRTVA